MKRSVSSEPRLGDKGGYVDVTTERTGEGVVYRAQPGVVTADTNVIERQMTVAPFKDRLRWGPIVGGLMTTIALLLLFTLLGLAIGLAVFEPNDDPTNIATSAAVWGAVSAILAFFLGGWVTGKTAAVENDDNALLNGFMVGASALALTLWLASMGVGNLLGGIGNNIDEIARVGRDQFANVDTQATAQNAQNTAVNAYDEARNGAWGTLAAMALALGASTVGDLLGHRSQDHHTKRDDFDTDGDNGHR